MGRLQYAGSEYRFDLRELAHVKIAVAQKLRRRESFFMNWRKPASEGEGRVTIWVAPGIPLAFAFRTPEQPPINANWVRALVELSRTPRGLTVISEQEAEAYVRERD